MSELARISVSKSVQTARLGDGERMVIATRDGTNVVIRECFYKCWRCTRLSVARSQLAIFVGTESVDKTVFSQKERKLKSLICVKITLPPQETEEIFKEVSDIWIVGLSILSTEAL